MRKLLTSVYVIGISLVVLISSTSAGWAEQYLCVAKASAGFSYNKQGGGWESTKFRTDDKFLINYFGT